jgi:hypothetical protein
MAVAIPTETLEQLNEWRRTTPDFEFNFDLFPPPVDNSFSKALQQLPESEIEWMAHCVSEDPNLPACFSTNYLERGRLLRDFFLLLIKEGVAPETSPDPDSDSDSDLQSKRESEPEGDSDIPY